MCQPIHKKTSPIVARQSDAIHTRVVTATPCDLKRSNHHGPTKRKTTPVSASPKVDETLFFSDFSSSCLCGTHQFSQSCLFQFSRAFEQRRVNNAMLRYETQSFFPVWPVSRFAVEAEVSRPAIVPDLEKGGWCVVTSLHRVLRCLWVMGVADRRLFRNNRRTSKPVGRSNKYCHQHYQQPPRPSPPPQPKTPHQRQH